MSIPADSDSTGVTFAAQPNAVFLFCGSKLKYDFVRCKLTLVPVVVNVYGKTHDSNLVFCVERITARPGDGVRTTHRWMDQRTYTNQHIAMWVEYNMEPSHAFDVGLGLRSATGERLEGSNELCEANSALKLDNIRSHYI